MKYYALRWRHNDHAGVSNHQSHGCLLHRLFRRRWKKTSKLRVTGLCAGNSPGPVNSPHKGPVTREMFPFDDVIMVTNELPKPGARTSATMELFSWNIPILATEDFFFSRLFSTFQRVVKRTHILLRDWYETFTLFMVANDKHNSTPYKFVSLVSVLSPLNHARYLMTYHYGNQSRGFLMGGDHYDHPLCPGLQPRPPSQTPWGLGQRYWSVSEVTWPPNLEFRRWGSSGLSSLMYC